MKNMLISQNNLAYFGMNKMIFQFKRRIFGLSANVRLNWQGIPQHARSTAKVKMIFDVSLVF